jgi:hypothetical protein
MLLGRNTLVSNAIKDVSVYTDHENHMQPPRYKPGSATINTLRIN